jgi:hypothetical protein
MIFPALPPHRPHPPPGGDEPKPARVRVTLVDPVQPSVVAYARGAAQARVNRGAYVTPADARHAGGPP